MAETLIAPGRYTCPVCGERHSFVSDKKAHMRTEHPRKPKAKRR